MSRIVRPTGSQRVMREDLGAAKWRTLDDAAFRKLWGVQADEAAARLDVEIIHIVTGLLLPVWSSLPDDDVRVWRLSTPDGTDMLGRIVPPRGLPA